MVTLSPQGTVWLTTRAYEQVGDLQREEATFRREDQRLCWAVSRDGTRLASCQTSGKHLARVGRGDEQESRIQSHDELRARGHCRDTG